MTLNKLTKPCALVPILWLCGCGSDEPVKTETPPPTVYPDGVSVTDDGLAFSTENFDVGVGRERFLCYAKTLDHDAVIDAYHYQAHPAVHHLVFSRTTGTEPDGYSECDVLFRPTWQPLFIATTAEASLEIPEGAANVLPAGTRLLIQLHLLNSSNEDVTDRAAVTMHSSTLSAPRPAGIFVFGTMQVALPALQQTTLEANCTVPRDVSIFAMLPHMHYLGRELEFAMGPDATSLQTVLTRNPYDFNDQRLDVVSLTVPSGYATKTSCSYDNTTDQQVVFGESSLNEMCFEIGFALDVDGVKGCLDRGTASTQEYPRDPNAGACSDVVGNSIGIGAPCTQGGGQCPAPLQCSEDLQSSGTGQGTCLLLNCSSTADCGGGNATCCSYQGLVNVCVAEACRPLQCQPLP